MCAGVCVCVRVSEWAWHFRLLLIVTYCELTVRQARHQLLHEIFIKKGTKKPRASMGIFDYLDTL